MFGTTGRYYIASRIERRVQVAAFVVLHSMHYYIQREASHIAKHGRPSSYAGPQSILHGPFPSLTHRPIPKTFHWGRPSSEVKQGNEWSSLGSKTCKLRTKLRPPPCSL